MGWNFLRRWEKGGGQGKEEGDGRRFETRMYKKIKTFGKKKLGNVIHSRENRQFNGVVG